MKMFEGALSERQPMHPRTTITRACNLLVALAACCLLPALAGAQNWRIAQPDYAWSFPRDHWARSNYKTEWWYFTGHLDAADGRRFGYQFTFFRVGLSPEKPDLDSAWATSELIMGHAAISDLAQKQHYFAEVLYRTTPLLGGFATYPDTLIAWSRGPAGTPEHWTLSWNGSGFDFAMADQGQGIAFALHTVPQKPLIFQGPNGYSRKGAGASAASHYYSFTRLRTTGVLKVGGKTAAVSGDSWMDKEFGTNQLGEHQVGWDWFSLQLADGREIMLYILRDTAGKVDYGRATLVAADGTTRFLKRESLALRTTKKWTSPQTKATYPAGWELNVDGETFLLTAEMADQENRSALGRPLFYWEGAVRVSDGKGRQLGKGYVELTGYGTGNRPGI